MNIIEQKRVIIDNMLNLLELPDSAYDKARKRYEDLGEWFDREDSAVSGNSPHVFPQGSFRLGTAIRPLNESEEYDLDLACKLQEGISKDTHTQENLKKLVGIELEAYRQARGIKNGLEAKHRCWRLEYQDDLSFHMDIVPCIPADENRRKAILESIRGTGLDEFVAGAVSQTTVSITDDRHEGYKQIRDDWGISNPEGYAKWFEYRMNPKQTRTLLEKAQVDDVPLFKKKTPLQRVIQILKRHRDNWSKDDPESKPISIIITTLAAKAYSGETDIIVALDNVLEKMGGLVRPSIPRIPNPVDPEEDFADRWYRADSIHLKLEEHFRAWIMQAKIDFNNLTQNVDAKSISEHLQSRFAVDIGDVKLAALLNIGGTAAPSIQPHREITNPPKPWGAIV